MVLFLGDEVYFFFFFIIFILFICLLLFVICYLLFVFVFAGLEVDAKEMETSVRKMK